MAMVARLTANLFANTSKFETGMKRSRKSFRAFQNTVKKGAKAAAAALAGIGVALTALTIKQSQVIDETAKLSKALGVNIREFQALVLAASESGISQDQFATIITKSQRTIVEAARGLETYKRAFDTLNLSAVDLLRLSPEEQFKEIAKALNTVDNATLRTATALEIFGRSGRQVINMLDGLIENVDSARAFNDKFGISLNAVDASKVEEANDIFARARKAIGGLGNIIAVQVAPIITEISQLFLDSGFTAESFGDSVKRGMDAAAKAIDVVRAGILGLKVIFLQVMSFIDLGTLDATKNLFDLVQILEKIPGLANRLTGVSAALLRANKNAAAAAGKHLDAIEDLTEGAKDFKSAQEALVKVQAEATKRAFERSKIEVKGQMSINQLMDEATEKTKKLTEEERKRIKNAKELGFTFSSAFEDAIVSGKRFSDVLKGLAQDIERILIRRTITEPLGNAVSDFALNTGGSFLSNLFSGFSLPSFGSGTNFVPRDMIAQVHRGEAIVPAFDVNKLSGGGGGGGVAVIINNNTSAAVTQSSRDTANGTELTLMIDHAVADNINKPGSRTAQSLKALQDRALIRR